MKVYPVSLLHFKSSIKNENYENNVPFLYTLPESKNHDDALKKYALLTAFSALSAVIVTLFNINRKKQFPFSIADIVDVNKGLNKIKNQDKLINSIKTDFIYPIKAFTEGDKNINRTKEFKTGLILTGQSANNLADISDALTEHFDVLGIKTVKIDHVTKRLKDGLMIEHPIRRNELNKQIINQVNLAHQIFKEKGIYTVINIGDIDRITDLKVVKSQNSNFENLISTLNKEENFGAVWIGYTDKQKQLPLIFNYLPILIKK